MSILSIRNLTKTYGKVRALNNLSLEVEQGTITGLLGPNGSGKTTTLGIILGILAADSGSYEWFDGKYGDYPRLHIGSILETPNFYPYLDADRNLGIIARIRDVQSPKIDELLATVNLEGRRTSKFRTYSLGMKQRLAIAATLIGDPEVVIFDEPTNGLDPQGIAEVRTILKRVADSGKTVIMASHILDEVEKICSHVAIIKYGDLLATGPIGSILSDDHTLEVSAVDRSSLHQWLQALPFIKEITDRTTFYECRVASDYPLADFNGQAFSAGHALTHLVARKQRLEEEFLEITK